MAILFTNIEEVKTFIGGGANMSMAIESLEPTMLMAAEEHIIPWVGRALWDDIVSAFSATQTAEQTALLPYLQRPLAMLSLFEYAKIGNIQFSEEGMHRIETDIQKSAYKYQENAYKKWMLENGYAAIELLLNFLEANEDDYLLWRNHATVYVRNKSLFINTAADFRDNYSKSMSRYTFEMLRSLMEDVEEFAIKPLLGEAQYIDLKDAILTKSVLNIETALILKIRKAVAHFTIEEAIRQHWIQLDGNKVIAKETLGDQSYEKEGQATREKVSLAIRRADEWANRHIALVKKFLTANIDDYPLYKAHIDALAAAEVTTDLTGEDCCEQDGCYLSSKKKRKGVIRL